MFTDKDLRRLKKFIKEDKKYTKSWPMSWVKHTTMDSLIDRLDAAEKALNQLEKDVKEWRNDWSEFDGRDLLNQFNFATKAWRLSKGLEEGKGE